jgi:hypothetical protein
MAQNNLFSFISKQMKTAILALSTIAIVFQSCSLEKRYHSGGYSISWSDKLTAHKSSPNPKSKIASPKFSKISQSGKSSEEQDKITNSIGSILDLKSVNNLSESNGSDFFYQTNDNQKLTLEALKSTKESEFKNVKNANSELVKPIIKSQVQANNASRGANVLLGILLLIVALWFAWNISMLLGLILFFVALFVMSSGRGKDKNNKEDKTTENEKNNSTLVDVVYLKNGSIIVGSIIEQVPNENLKIQTKDGSVFVYSMSDIARITKEKR